MLVLMFVVIGWLDPRLSPPYGPHCPWNGTEPGNIPDRVLLLTALGALPFVALYFIVTEVQGRRAGEHPGRVFARFIIEDLRDTFRRRGRD